MATGYTHPVCDGEVTDFTEFALMCARAFGATIMQRDAPLTEPPTLPEVPEHYRTNVEKARQRVLAIEGWTVAEAQDAADAAHAESMRSREEYIAEQTARVQRCHDMLEQVERWEPPTSDHVRMKEFMVEQLAETIGFEEPGTYTPSPTDGAEYRAQELARARRALDVAHESLGREIANTEGRAAWITALYESLGLAVGAPR